MPGESNTYRTTRAQTRSWSRARLEDAVARLSSALAYYGYDRDYPENDREHGLKAVHVLTRVMGWDP